MKTFEIDFTAEDFARYYNDTILLLSGAAFYVNRVDDGSVTGTLYKTVKDKGEKMSIRLKELMTWDKLKQPTIGWTSLDNRPVYMQRLPVRQITKGISTNNVVYTTVPWWSDLLRALEQAIPYEELSGPHSEYHTQFRDVLTAVLEHAHPQNKPIEQEVASLLDGDKLFSVLSPKAMICINPFSKQTPILGFAGDVMTATYSSEGKLLSNNTALWQEALQCG